MKKIILCADDFGLNPNISIGVTHLIAANRISATSCITNSKHWQSSAARLMPFKNKIDMGLHFNLTEGHFLSTGKPLFQHPNLLVKAFTNHLSTTAIINEFACQLDAFEQSVGQTPDFIDGHQHIHHLPIIRDALLTVYQEKFCDTKPYFRMTENSKPSHNQNFSTFIKRKIISITGAKNLRQQLKHLQIPFNSSFSGVYHFKKAENFRQYFQTFLSEISANGIIMCHPGFTSQQYPDALHFSRPEEYRYFMSDAFLKDCEQFQVTIGKF